MSYELTAILVVAVVMGLAQAVATAFAILRLRALWRGTGRSFEVMDRRFGETPGEMRGGLEEIRRTNRAIAALVTHESEIIKTLLRT